MKLKLFLIIIALLAAHPASVFADDIIEFEDDIFNIEFIDSSSFEDEAQFMGDEVAWDGVTLAEVIPEDSVYHIYNGAQLAWIAEQVNTPDGGGMVNCVISIEADIDLAGYNWIPIGCSYNTPFAGIMNGNGYTVSGLNFDCSSYTHGGLFGCVIGKISNLSVEGNIETARCLTPSSSDSSKNGIGILAGSLDARNFDYNTKDYVGVIEDCSVYGSLSVNNSYGEAFYVGGIVGMNSGGEMYRNISSAVISVASTDTNGTDEAYVGGIVGFNTGYCTGSFPHIFPDDSEESAFLANAPCDSFASIVVQSANPSAGGISGGNSGTLEKLIADSDLKVTKLSSAFDDNYANIGGIVGVNTGDVNDTMSGLSFKSSFSDDSALLNAGGICGLMYGNINEDGEILSTAVISDSFSIAGDDLTINSPSNLGGIVGMISNSAGIVTDCYGGTYINIEEALYKINAGGIAGSSYGVIDSCKTAVSELSVKSSVSACVGSVAGVSYNTISDCITSDSSIALSSSSPMAVLYCGGIAGESYGRVRRCTSGTELNVSGSLAYAGGIAGRAEYDEDKSIITSSGEGLISKCTSDTNITCTNVAGGIVGDAYNASIRRSYSNANITNAVGAGGIAGRAGSTDIENCMVEGTLNTSSNSGAVYEFSNSDNSITTSYFAPKMIGEVKHAISIADVAKYKTQRSYLNTDITGVNTVDGISAVTNETAKLRETFNELNFDSVWTMNDEKPSLQYIVNSNALNTVGEITETRMHFNISLENPGVGQRVYVALYDENDRFCGTVSAVCTRENINSTGTRADFALEYSYDYYNYETWEPSDSLPLTYKAFTWDEENGMKSLSSVDEGVLIYYFE